MRNRKNIIIRACFIFSLSLFIITIASIGNTEVKPLTKILHEFLVKDCGLEYHSTLPDGNVVYGKYKNVVLFKVDYKGNVIEGGTIFSYDCDAELIDKILYAIYGTLQLNMGKNQIIDKKIAKSKMRNLFGAIASNLKLSNETKFQYDDLWVKATKDPKERFISIKFWPRWK